MEKEEKKSRRGSRREETEEEGGERREEGGGRRKWWWKRGRYNKEEAVSAEVVLHKEVHLKSEASSDEESDGYQIRDHIRHEPRRPEYPVLWRGEGEGERRQHKEEEQEKEEKEQ